MLCIRITLLCIQLYSFENKHLDCFYAPNTTLNTFAQSTNTCAERHEIPHRELSFSSMRLACYNAPL
jgi:hypothetical protein